MMMRCAMMLYYIGFLPCVLGTGERYLHLSWWVNSDEDEALGNHNEFIFCHGQNQMPYLITVKGSQTTLSRHSPRIWIARAAVTAIL